MVLGLSTNNPASAELDRNGFKVCTLYADAAAANLFVGFVTFIDLTALTGFTVVEVVLATLIDGIGTNPPLVGMGTCGATVEVVDTGDGAITGTFLLSLLTNPVLGRLVVRLCI